MYAGTADPCFQEALLVWEPLPPMRAGSLHFCTSVASPLLLLVTQGSYLLCPALGTQVYQVLYSEPIRPCAALGSTSWLPYSLDADPAQRTSWPSSWVSLR
jgi:hypothetical protein